MTRITFKSIPPNWWKEFIGLKNNTVRKIYLDGDIRFELLNKFITQPFKLEIEIVNTETNDSFIRLIRDVTEFDGYMIISW